MSEDNKQPNFSPLYQSVTRDDKTVKIAIYKDGKGGWVLEIVDEHWNSTIWDVPFPTDREALEEALRTIDEEGIESLIGTPSDSPASPQQPNSQQPNPWQSMAPLTEAETEELDQFLMSDATSDETMQMDCLDGYLTAIVTGPVTLKPSEWLPRVWGPSANDEPVFDNFAQAERITGLIFRQMNGIIWSLQNNPDTFQPVFDTSGYPDDAHEYMDGEMWASGYMTGINLQRQNWNVFFDEQNSQEVLRPIYLLGADDITPEDEELIRDPSQREELSKQISASVAWIYRFCKPYRQAVAERTIATTFQREHPKVGRNDPCPCGSGKKFKKCCGVATVLH